MQMTNKNGPGDERTWGAAGGFELAGTTRSTTTWTFRRRGYGIWKRAKQTTREERPHGPEDCILLPLLPCFKNIQRQGREQRDALLTWFLACVSCVFAIGRFPCERNPLPPFLVPEWQHFGTFWDGNWARVIRRISNRSRAVGSRDYRCEDGRFQVASRCVTISNPNTLSNSETWEVNPGIWSGKKKHSSDWARFQKAIGGIYFTKKWRAEILQPGLEFDSFKPRLKSCIFKCISWLNGSIFGDDRFFLRITLKRFSGVWHEKMAFD